MSDPVSTSVTTIVQDEGFRFRVLFDEAGVPALVTDEPPPLGCGAGPNPSRLLAAAVGNCLAASLLFCMQKARLDVAGLVARVETDIGRNEQGRLRVRAMRVTLAPAVTEQVQARMGRCLDLFESFCAVTESIRHGVDVQVTLAPVVTSAVDAA